MLGPPRLGRLLPERAARLFGQVFQRLFSLRSRCGLFDIFPSGRALFLSRHKSSFDSQSKRNKQRRLFNRANEASEDAFFLQPQQRSGIRRL